MAKIENIEDHRLGERLTAHLAMGAAGEPEKTGDCLSDDQLADVATNFCSKEERAAALTHFSSCPRCYNAWVAISMSLMAIESGATKPSKWHRSIKGLTYLGSALAVAASVVVFFNIREMSFERGVKEPVEHMQSVAPVSPAAMDQENKQKRENRASETSTPAPLKKSRSEFGSSATEVSTDGKGDIEAGSTSVKEPETSSAPAAFTEMEADSKELKGVLTDAWLGNVEALCKGSESMRDFARWKGLQEEGRVLVAQESNAIKRQRMEAVLAIMTATDRQPVMAEQCDRILPLLAGEDDTM